MPSGPVRASLSPWLKLPPLGRWTRDQRVLGTVLSVHSHSFLFSYCFQLHFPVIFKFQILRFLGYSFAPIPILALLCGQGLASFSVAPPAQKPEKQVVSSGILPGSCAHPVSEREFGAQGGLYFLPISGWSLSQDLVGGGQKRRKLSVFPQWPSQDRFKFWKVTVSSEKASSVSLLIPDLL